MRYGYDRYGHSPRPPWRWDKDMYEHQFSSYPGQRQSHSPDNPGHRQGGNFRATHSSPSEESSTKQTPSSGQDVPPSSATKMHRESEINKENQDSSPPEGQKPAKNADGI